LRGFLGLIGYYRKFIKHYGLLSKPLSDLLKKNVQFQWTAEANTAFEQLKAQLIQALVLAVPDFSQQFVIETDASDLGIGAVLMQNHHPVAYLSKALGPRNQALSVYEKECLAILLAVEKWRPYL
jgi:ABC-type antimicrobial peptide transport system ATPase subunit